MLKFEETKFESSPEMRTAVGRSGWKKIIKKNVYLVVKRKEKQKNLKDWKLVLR